MKCCDCQERMFDLNNRITALINRLNETSYMIFSKDVAKILLEELNEEEWGEPTCTETGERGWLP